MIERKCKITQQFREFLRSLVNTMLAKNPDLREFGTATGSLGGTARRLFAASPIDIAARH